MVGFYQEIKRLKDFSFFLEQLVKRDLKVKYKRSILGFLWTMLNPLLMLAILSFVFSNLFKTDIPDYSIYVFVGLVYWNFISQATMGSMAGIVSSGSLIKKVAVPKVIFPVSIVISSVINLLLALIPLIILVIVMGVPLSFNLLFVPFALLLLLAFTIGISLILATLNVFFRDVSHIYNVLLMGLMYMTPLWYPISIVPEKYVPFVKYNPLNIYLTLFRDPIYNSKIPDNEMVLIGLIIALLSFFIGFDIFRKKQNDFINYI